MFKKKLANKRRKRADLFFFFEKRTTTTERAWRWSVDLDSGGGGRQCVGSCEAFYVVVEGIERGDTDEDVRERVWYKLWGWLRNGCFCGPRFVPRSLPTTTLHLSVSYSKAKR
jgi:hypothetical protein